MALNIEGYLNHNYPSFNRLPAFVRRLIVKLLRTIFHEEEINTFLEANRQKEPFSFIEAVLEHFNTDIIINRKELARIPSYGRVVIIANHPLGALDALALLYILKDVRKDVKIVATSFLSLIDNVTPLLVPVDNIRGRVDKSSLQNIYHALQKEQAVVIFPSGEVSRARPTGVRDTKWQSGFYKIASKMRAPILPIHIDAKNSRNFYLLSMLNKSLAVATLPHEMFKFHDKKIGFRIGNSIAYDDYYIPSLSNKEIVKLFRRHFYRVAKRKRPIFKTYSEIALAESRQELKAELMTAADLGKTTDGKTILLYESENETTVLKEIGRLREISFRQVNEGSGKKRDLDVYDYHYQHIILWDDEALEIVGSYRIGHAPRIIEAIGIEGLYTSTLFRFEEPFEQVFKEGIELGRSFVQPKYWNSRALDLLWQGIGAYLKANPDIRYMFGPVSISNAYNEKAKELLVYFFGHHFRPEKRLVHHIEPFRIPGVEIERFKEIFCGNDYKQDLFTLKYELQAMGYAIPTLYKQYSDLCEAGGVIFMDFGVDKDFADCIDGFLVVDTHTLKPQKRKRYIDR